MLRLLLPFWIFVAPFGGLFIISLAFRGTSSMSGGRGSRSDRLAPITRLSEVPY